MKKDKKKNSIENCNKKVGYNNSNDLHNQLDSNEATNKSNNSISGKSNNNVNNCGK